MNIVGIPNLRNSCFFNASLQSLIYNEKLYEILHDNKDKNDFINYFNLLQKICIQCEKMEKSDYINLIKNLYQSMIKSLKFIPGRQEDASECIEYMIDFFHESIKQEVEMKLKNQNYEPIEKESFNSWNKYYKDCYSPIIKYFYGQFGSTLLCSQCKKGLNKFDPFNVLSLSVDEKNHDVSDCLKNFCEMEELHDYKCDFCKEKHTYYKKTTFFILPYFLFIRLKNENTNDSKKQQILINRELNFTEYIYSSKNKPQTELNQIKYRLYAIIYHTGTLNGGHYYTCRIFGNRYFLFDDTNVQIINELPDKNASVLCYERIL